MELKFENIAVIVFVIIVVLFIIYKVFFENKKIPDISTNRLPEYETPEEPQVRPLVRLSDISANRLSDISANRPPGRAEDIKTIKDLLTLYCSDNIEQFIAEDIDNKQIKGLYNLLLTKLPTGLKNLIYCDLSNNVLDNKDNIYNIVICIRGQMSWWWQQNAYGQTDINMDDINLMMLIILSLLTMIEENKSTLIEIMSFDVSTNQVTIINKNLEQTIRDSDKNSNYLNKGANNNNIQYKATLDTSNNYVMDIMLFHAIFKQYMYKLIDIKKDTCDCKSQYTSLTQAQKEQIEAQFDQAHYQMLQARMQEGQAEMDAQVILLQAQAHARMQEQPAPEQVKAAQYQYYQEDLLPMQQAQVLMQGAQALVQRALTPELRQQAEALMKQAEALMQEAQAKTQTNTQLQVQLQALTQTLTQLQYAQEVAAL